MIKARKRFLRRVRDKISARWHMTLMCMTTVGAGVLFSKLLLFFKLETPSLRYGLAVLFSYAVFYLLVYLWLLIHFGRRKKASNSSLIDTVDAIDLVSGPSYGGPLPKGWKGGGGNFSGGGATGSWDGDAMPATAGSELVSSASKSTSSLAKVPDLDFDEAAVVLLFIGLVVAIFGSAGFLIYQAPEILFEAAFEVVLAGTLVKPAKKAETDGWQFAIFKQSLPWLWRPVT